MALPQFDAITANHISPALTELLEQAQRAVNDVMQNTQPASWENTAVYLESAIEPLEKAWSTVHHLSSVVDTAEIRAAIDENLPRITAFFSELEQNHVLYQRYKALALSAAFAELNRAQVKVVENALRDFRLGGAELDAPGKARLAEVKEQQAILTKAFSDHALDATDAYRCVVKQLDELSGLPGHAIAAARACAEEHGEEGWIFTLHYPSYFPVMQYADNRSLRERLFRAYVTRASELGPLFGDGKAEWDNTLNMVQQLKLRREEAQLLGFANYAELSLATKMASSPTQVKQFMTDLAQHARASAERDGENLRVFAKATLGLEQIEPWDIAYISEKLQQAEYAFAAEELRPYFPADAVLRGLFATVQRLFGIQIKPDVAPVWHQDVKFYRVETAEGVLLAQCYIDLYARTGKRSGAWMNGMRDRNGRHSAAVQTPVACLVCNFPPPLAEQPSLLSHDDVITLFHEFGHGLHHMLTQVDEPPVGGINGVEWDAVELPSQMLENFCWDWEVLQTISRHVDTGASLPRELFERMLAAKNFQKGMATLRQLIFASFDMAIHADFQLGNNVDRDGERVLELAQAINADLSVLPIASFSRWPHTFSHIFAGGYAAGYYSYKWAEVLSADAYAAFEEAAAERGSVSDAQVGARYCREILQAGGVRPALESFRAFRGRDPDIRALLRHDGILPSSVVNEEVSA